MNAGKRLKAGNVVHLRINPRDSLSCIDVVQKIQAYLPGMSFSQVVSLALSSLLEGMRQSELIPTRDGFEYADMMAPFQELGLGDRARKLEISREIYNLGSSIQVPAIPAESVIPPNAVQKQTRIRTEILENCRVQERSPDEQDILRMAQAIKENLQSQGEIEVQDEDIVEMAKVTLSIGS